MINDVNGFDAAVNFHNKPAFTPKLNEEQVKNIETILSSYNPDNMSQESEQQFMTEIKDAQIPAGRELKQIVEGAGFKLPTRQAKSNQYQQQPDSNTRSKSSPYTEVLQKYDLENLTDADIDNLLEKIKNTTGFSPKGIFIDIKA